ncbi:hypothetical protein BJB45_09340 [Halomonas huangheensis]|uniref:Uncharacterized protein n=1 Tax=Halomonas huangheensis TaxID=1178482 RepID=W1N9H5_9GAMM|nr:hypothetical protein BJB45_09340 [Halomonas huangheensis]
MAYACIGCLGRIAAYLSEHNPDAADMLASAIEAAAETLPEHPYLYRPGRVLGTREVVYTLITW